MADVSAVKLKKFLGGVCDNVETLLISFFAVMLIAAYVVRVTSVNGGSMETTLMSGDKVLVRLIGCKPENGDIVLIDAKNSYTYDDSGSLNIGEGLDKTIVKRVIAVGGQQVDIDFASGTVTLDGEKLSEDYVRLGLTHRDEGAFTGKYPVTVPEGYIFVMGDHRSVSKDSRSDEVGFVPVENVRGEVMFRIFPLKNFGKIK